MFEKISDGITGHTNDGNNIAARLYGVLICCGIISGFCICGIVAAFCISFFFQGNIIGCDRYTLFR